MVEIFNVELSLVAILVAIVVNMVVGMLWYGPLFGNMWLKLVGKKKSEVKMESSDIMWSLLGGLVFATGLAFLIEYITPLVDMSEYMAAVFVAVLGVVGFSVPLGINLVVWNGRKIELFWLDLAHQLTGGILMALTIVMLTQ
jgi:predicted CDP-diglyceride synthetase/phosphatidate cytidylyltransferase